MATGRRRVNRMSRPCSTPRRSRPFLSRRRHLPLPRSHVGAASTVPSWPARGVARIRSAATSSSVRARTCRPTGPTRRGSGCHRRRTPSSPGSSGTPSPPRVASWRRISTSPDFTRPPPTHRRTSSGRGTRSPARRWPTWPSATRWICAVARRVGRCWTPRSPRAPGWWTTATATSNCPMAPGPGWTVGHRAGSPRWTGCRCCTASRWSTARCAHRPATPRPPTWRRTSSPASPTRVERRGSSPRPARGRPACSPNVHATWSSSGTCRHRPSASWPSTSAPRGRCVPAPPTSAGCRSARSTPSRSPWSTVRRRSPARPPGATPSMNHRSAASSDRW